MTYYSKDAGSIVGCAERQGASYGRIGYVERKQSKVGIVEDTISWTGVGAGHVSRW